MRHLISCLCVAAVLFSAPVTSAEQTEATKLLRQELAAKVPSTWQVHVTRRGADVLAFVTPPYQEAFDLWYKPQKLRETLRGLCPPAGDAIWAHLAATQNLVLQPTVGGKSADSMRISYSRPGEAPHA